MYQTHTSYHHKNDLYEIQHACSTNIIIIHLQNKQKKPVSETPRIHIFPHTLTFLLNFYFEMKNSTVSQFPLEFKTYPEFVVYHFECQNENL